MINPAIEIAESYVGATYKYVKSKLVTSPILVVSDVASTLGLSNSL